VSSNRLGCPEIRTVLRSPRLESSVAAVAY